MRRAIILLLPLLPLYSLPQYTAREGRQCDSCHAYPFPTTQQQGWKDPAVAERKCNLSCLTCHVDPGGGGMRTVSGRYLASSTLPIFNNEIRPWHDQDRNLSNIADWFRKKTPEVPAAPAPEQKPKPGAKPVVEIPKALPEKFHTHESPPDFTWADPTVYGKSANAMTANRTYSPEFGAYGKLNADSKLQIGGDIRIAHINNSTRVATFPMQFDLGARYHPVEHWTIATTLGLVGQADNSESARPRTLGEMWTIRSAFAMYHELPYQMFFRAGFFQPSFGVRQEDHTAPVRTNFEMDLSRKYSAVLGAEAGFAANYPYLTVSVFTNNAGPAVTSTSQEFVVNPQGFGTTVNGGWRDLLWGAGSSFMYKTRPALYGGTLVAGSVDSYFNLGRIFLKVPVTLMGEYAVGRTTGTLGVERLFAANFIELNYVAFNGVNLKVNHHHLDADLRARGTTSGRFGFGIELIPVTFAKIYFEYRLPWRVDAARLSGDGFINPFDWLYDKQFILIGHIYF
jgi:hypothetical protein